MNCADMIQSKHFQKIIHKFLYGYNHNEILTVFYDIGWLSRYNNIK